MRDEEALRVPPHAGEAEQSVLGGLLLDNDAIDRIGDLAAAHFYRRDHQVIFAAIATLVAANKPADVVTVFDALRTQAPEAGGLVYLNQLASNTPSSANIRRYADIVRDRAMRRAIISVSDEIAEQAFAGEQDARALLDAAGSKLEKLAETRRASEPVRAGDDMPKHLEVIDQRTQGVTRAIPTGFGDLDKRLDGGMRRGQVIVVAGRPSMGKTAFALQVARHVAVDYSALVLSMEMPRAELHDRNLAAIGCVDLSNLLSVHGLQDDEWPRVVRASEQVSALNLYIDDQGALRLLNVRMKARLVKRRHGLDVLVIDYLGLMEGDGTNRYTQIDAITRGLKALAKELDVAIILLAQLNRDLEKRDNKRPQMSDLRDSGSIEQDADIILMLYRDAVYHPETENPNVCEVIVTKTRQGAPGRVALDYIGHQVRFESRVGGYQPDLGMAPRRAKPRQFEDAS